MADDIGPVEAPVAEQLGKEVVLDAERHILPVSHLGLPVAEEVEEEDLVPLREVRRDPVPDVRRKRRAMNEDHG
jgi:hypothetical protein